MSNEDNIFDVDAVVAAMTLDEKCACLTGEGYWELGGCPRLGVDPILVSDGPHGLRKQSGAADNLGLAGSDPAVCFPTASAAACTFNIDLLHTMGEALGDEACEQNVAIVLGPGVNMKRSPLCGRNFEYFSEDPHLAGELAAAYIEGVQSRGVGTSLKHFACNNQETNRLIVDTVVDDRALHEVYLEPFRIAVERAHPWTIMTAYNLLDGAYCSENKRLMSLARSEWGFDGAFVTDWGAENSNTESLPAGLDLVMPGVRPDFREDVATAIAEGLLSEERLNDAVRHVLTLHARSAASRNRAVVRKVRARLDVARMVAEEAAVLLKNDGVLPLVPGARVAVVGVFAREPRYQGAGSSKINPVVLDCAFDALVEAGVSCTYAPGYEAGTGETSEDLLATAIDTAAQADVAVVFVGLPDASESEGSDRVDMALPSGHDELVRRVCAANPHTIVVLQGGSPVELPWRESPRAILLSYLSGCQGGHATANLLLGQANPSGKLAETWPERLADTPCVDYYPERARQALYKESIYTGYRYYDTAGISVAYPFGHGLSYTTFSYHDLRAEVGEAADAFCVSCLVRNDGERVGKEAVQLYIAPIDCAVFRAAQELKAFAKVQLEPGEERRVCFALPRRAFAHFDSRSQSWEVEAGSYEIRIASSSRDIRLHAQVEVLGSLKRPDGAPESYHFVQPGGFSNTEFAALYGKPLPKVVVAMRPYTANATVGDLRASLVGRAVHYMLRRVLKLFMPGDTAARAEAELMVMDTPLRSLAMSGVDMNIVGAAVDILNYRFIRGIKRLHAVRHTGSVDEGAPIRTNAAASVDGTAQLLSDKEGENE